MWDVDTFVIRLWSPADTAATTLDDPRGVARHVATGRAGAFRDGTELLALLRELPRCEADPAITPIDAGTEPD
jgi:hypothetical protein